MSGHSLPFASLLRLRRRRSFTPVALVAIWTATIAGCSAKEASEKRSSGLTQNNVELGDIQMFYRTGGSGPPLVFLHGGFGSSDTWDPYFDLLGDSFRLIALDSRGQGRTTLGDGPISYGRMAADVISLLDHLNIPKAHFVGYSDGGCTTLHLLTDYAERVLSATLIGTPFHTENYSPNAFRTLEQLLSDFENDTPAAARWKSAYVSVAPDPNAWPELVRRLGKTWRSQPSFTGQELQAIDRPVLVVKVDRDPFLPSMMFDRTAALIPGARILHLPDGTHSVPRDQPDQLAAGIAEFIQSLDSPKP